MVTLNLNSRGDISVISHERDIITTVRRDGDLDAAVVRVDNTGSASAATEDRYRHTIVHGLGRVPVGCQVILKDKDCDVYVISSNENQITVRFTAAEASVNVRIW